MCGIVGIVSADEVALVLVKCMARLVYRGDESWGVASRGSGGIEVLFHPGEREHFMTSR
jgi:glucosamine 6-phosphate synthetase-like amidotransferase/phosphosugar isomerase protein